jgi:hypothetical protein
MMTYRVDHPHWRGTAKFFATAREAWQCCYRERAAQLLYPDRTLRWVREIKVTRVRTPEKK